MASYRPTLSHEFNEDLLKLPAAVQAKANRTVFRMLENPWAAQFHPSVRQAVLLQRHLGRSTRLPSLGAE